MHLKKLCVGCESIDDLASWQKRRLRELKDAGKKPILRHVTRHAPKQRDALLAQGSLYWIIKGWMLVRQRITGLDMVEGEDGETRCAILLNRQLVRVVPMAHRPFQGWRYLPDDAAPLDLRPDDDQLPAHLVAELRSLGLF